MFLKSIEILGFKSFADRSRIEFTDGIAALLGPNGCGKSNIVDAIKWVLGEQSTRSLRAEKMEDVIFNGTETRRPLNVAEVTLNISNDNNLLNLDMPEISIKRRLFRSGESEYFVNNTPVRLKELKELFFDTGIGKSAYSIMEQGKIDQVLSHKPEERRSLFEEAAGITRFKMKGQEASRKLGRTVDNMQQVRNILAEVKRSYDSLDKQSKKTLQFRDYKEKLFNLEIKLDLLKLKDLYELKSKKSRNLENQESVYKSIEEELNSLDKLLSTHQSNIQDMQDKKVHDEKAIFGIDLEIQKLSERKKFLNEQLLQLAGRLEEIRRQIEEVKKNKQKINDNILEKKAALDGFALKERELENEISSLTKNQDNLQKTVESYNSAIKNNEQIIQDSEIRQEEFQLEIRNLTDQIVVQLASAMKEYEHLESGRLSAIESLEKQIDIITDENNPDWAVWLEIFRDKVSGLKTMKSTQLEELLSPGGNLNRKTDLDEQVRQAVSARNSSRAFIDKDSADRELALSGIQDNKTALGELKIEKVRVITQTSSVNDQIKSLLASLAAQDAVLEDHQQNLNRVERDHHEQSLAIGKNDRDIKASLDEKESLGKQLTSLEKNILNKNQGMANNSAKRKDKSEKLEKSRWNTEKIKLELENLDTELKRLFQEFRERNSRELKEFEQQIDVMEESPSSIRSEMSELKQNVKSLGHLNLMAPEEFAEVKERYEFLDGQLNDLSRARDDLEKVTSEIEKESTELFLEAYSEIKKNFHNMFRSLFGGGRAELKLLDPDNPLDSGIDIYAQPPGKKLENISLLSGGERSLAGVALLFATYMVKPAPFCILDEIDAALDEQNISRFVNVLKDFGEKSQFVIITHNKKTVIGAETLLGVTMQDSGVSRIISIRLDQEKQKV